MCYYGRLLDGSSLEAELWEIYRGLKIIAAQDLKNVDIESESDTEVAVNLIKNGRPHCPHKTLVEECRELLARSGSSIGHILKEGRRKQDGR